MVVPFVYTEEEYKKLEKERDNCLKEVKLCYNDIHSLEGQISDLEEENRKLKESLDIATKCSSKEEDGIIRLSEENKELKSELSKFRDSFKKYRDYEKEELAESCYDFARENDKLKEDNKKLKANYYNLSKIVEVSGGYKASYVNELRDKIAKLEFDIEAWKKLKAVREEKIRILNEKIGKLVMNGK